MKPTEQARALLAMAPMLAGPEVAVWSPRLAELLLAGGKRRLGRALRREALAALVARWNDVPAEVRAVVAADEGAVRAAREAWVGADAAARASVTAFVAEHTWAQTPDLLLEALADPDAENARAAGAALVSLAERADPAMAEAVDVLLAMAVETFDVHQSRAALSAVVAHAGVARRGAAAWRAAADRQELRPAMGGALRSGVSALYRVRAWEHLGEAWLTPAAAARLTATAGVAEHEQVLERAHLGLREGRARAVAGLGARERGKLLEALAPLQAGVMNKLGEGAWVGMAQIMRVLGDGAGRRETLARAALGHPSAAVRLAAMRAAPRRTVVDYAFDADARVAESAALAAAGSEGPWSALQRSPHERVRRLAAQEAGLAGLVWGLSGAEVVGLRRRLAADPAGLERSWRGAWEAGDAEARALLMRVASRIGLLGRVGSVVVGAADPEAAEGSAEARLAATAAVVLGGAGEEVAGGVAAVSACLNACDARVRANAVEVVREATQVLVELKSDANHRVRANAVRALAVRGGMPGSAVLLELARLLVSPEELDRRAGVWLAGRVGASGGPLGAEHRRGVATLVERRLAKEDQAGVAARMASCVARLRADAEGGEGGVGGVLQEAA